MKDYLINYLKAYKKITIPLEDIEKRFQGKATTYEEFARTILELEQAGIVEMVKSKGRNSKVPSLAFQYRIQKGKLQQSFHQELQQYRIMLHSLIKLDAYYSLHSDQWYQDLPYIKKIDHYLCENPLPKEAVPAPERSFELVGDEKWITEKQGKECLERIALWDKLNIIPVSDPLMFATNPHAFQNTQHHHFIVENKTTYQGLLEALSYTLFTTLIYGCGKKIVKGIEHLENQLPLKDANHTLHYFGDLDYEGISIWYSLQKRVETKLALPFYRACLNKRYVHGKQNQRRNDEALSAFLQHFELSEQQAITEMFDNGGYYPQEVLKTVDLQQIWRNTSWT